MKTKYTLFRRGEMFYMQDSAPGKQTSLRTKDETEAKSLLHDPDPLLATIFWCPFWCPRQSVFAALRTAKISVGLEFG